MRYNQIREIDISNGEGVGVALFVQGCPSPHCKNCFNPETWNFNGGKEWTTKIEDKFFELIDKPYIKRISLLGGECLAQQNVVEVTRLAKKCKEEFHQKKIWLWSRYDFEKYISYLEITKYVDYIIDGEFIEKLKDISLLYRGSSNQQIWKKENEKWHNVTKILDKCGSVMKNDR